MASATSSEIENRSTPGIDATSLADALAGDHEERLDQVRRRQLGLADQVARRLGRRRRRMRVAGKLTGRFYGSDVASGW